MAGFRIMPAQRMDRQIKSGTRFGFVIHDHPLGIASDTPHGGYLKGDYIASWADIGEATAAAYALGIDPREVQGVPTFIPEA